MIFHNIFVRKNKYKGNMFFMRFQNTTGSAVTINTLRYLINDSYSPTRRLLTAVVERSGGVDNVYSGGTINDFIVANGESCVFRMTWDGGMYSLQGHTSINSNSYKDIVRSAGCEIRGYDNVPNYFMRSLFQNCVNYNQQPGDIFDTSQWYPTSIGDDFMYRTWSECSSLANPVTLNTTNWNITGSIGQGFLTQTWFYCTSLLNSVAPDTSNWTVGPSLGNYFMYSTWTNCPSLMSVVLPDTTNWNVTSVGSTFMSQTLTSSFLSTGIGTTCELGGNLYVSFPSLTWPSLGITNSRIQNIKVDAALIPTYQSSSAWSSITPSSKFIAR